MQTPITCHVDLAREWRGGQRQVYLLTTGLVARGWRTIVVTRPETPLAQRLAGTGVEVQPVRMMGEFDLFAARRLATIVQESRAALLAAHASHAHGLAVHARKLMGETIKLVVHRRVDAPIAANRKYRAPDAFIAISNAVRDVLLAGGVAQEKIHVVSSGAPPHEHDAQAKARLTNECKIPADALWVGCVADLVEHKGHRHLLAAWPRVLEQFPQAHLMLVGDGPLRQPLQTAVKKSGITDSVHFIGRRDDISAWFSAFDVFALTSETEGLGSSIIDAMLARVPVVAADAGGIGELVREGETGRLLPVGDEAAIATALNETLTGGAGVEQRVEAALRMAQSERSAEAMVEKTMAVYRSLLSK